jgi:hypothetical protein
MLQEWYGIYIFFDLKKFKYFYNPGLMMGANPETLSSFMILRTINFTEQSPS